MRRKGRRREVVRAAYNPVVSTFFVPRHTLSKKKFRGTLGQEFFLQRRTNSYFFAQKRVKCGVLGLFDFSRQT
jgi:hypothetical protein